MSILSPVILMQKLNLPYRLLCDPKRVLIGALTGTKSSTRRRYVEKKCVFETLTPSHFVVDQNGKLTISSVGVKPGEVRLFTRTGN